MSDEERLDHQRLTQRICSKKKRRKKDILISLFNIVQMDADCRRCDYKMDVKPFDPLDLWGYIISLFLYFHISKLWSRKIDSFHKAKFCTVIKSWLEFTQNWIGGVYHNRPGKILYFIFWLWSFSDRHCTSSFGSHTQNSMNVSRGEDLFGFATIMALLSPESKEFGFIRFSDASHE